MYVMGYITCESKEQSKSIAQSLLSNKLIACANILPEIESHYTWQGRLEQSTESLLIIKSKTDLISKIKQNIQALHSYECPCIVFYEAKDGLASYLDWISEQLT